MARLERDERKAGSDFERRLARRSTLTQNDDLSIMHPGLSSDVEGGRLQIETPPAFALESMAGFVSICSRQSLERNDFH